MQVPVEAYQDIKTIEALPKEVFDLINETYATLNDQSVPLTHEHMECIKERIEEAFHDVLKSAREAVREYEEWDAADYKADVNATWRASR